MTIDFKKQKTMNKIFFNTMAASLFILASCEYNEAHFDGLDDKTALSDIKKIEYTLTDADYASISTNAANVAIATEANEKELLAALRNGRVFTPSLSAQTYIPAFLAAKWPTADNGSSIKVTYQSATDLPAYLNTLANAETYTVTAENYSSVWGTVNAKYFTPSKPLSAYASKFLTAAFPSAVNGDIKYITYKYSSSEPATGTSELTSIDEEFNSVTANAKIELNGWINKATKGSVEWQGKVFSGNYYAQCSSFGTTGQVESWLISPQLTLANVENPQFAFETKLGFYNADCLSILISDDFNGDDPSTATWKDVTHHFAFFAPASGYGPAFYIAGLYNLSAFKAKPIHIAFKYAGDATANQSTTYQIDNIQIGSNLNINATTIYDENFTSGLGNWTNTTAKGTKAWELRTFSGNSYAQYSAHNTTEEQIGWLISPDIAVPATGATELQFDVNVGYYNASCLNVYVSTNYTDNIETATWEDVTKSFLLPTGPTSAYGTITLAGAAPLNKYAGQTIRVAFKYSGNGAESRTTTYQVDNVKVINLTRTATAGAPMLKSASSALPSTMIDIYIRSGSSWTLYNDATILNPADYSRMGISYFSSAIKPENYLPQYLSLTHPYAQDGKKAGVVYYYNNTNTLNANEYTYTLGSWVKTVSSTPVTDQFVRANGKWFYNPSVVINLSPIRNNADIMAYYQAATDWVWENIDQAELSITTKGQGYVTSFGNNEYYTGCSALLQQH
jgi:hypothetical protein